MGSVVALDFVAASKSVAALESVAAVDSVVVLDSVEALDFEMALDFVNMVVDFVESLCPHCGTFHAGGVFEEACFQARRRARRCAHRGLLHEDYDLTVRWFDGMEKFDCEIYVPDVEKLQMDGDTILLPEHVIKKLDEIKDAKKLEDAKMKQDAKEQ
jgi:hypothetical protein